MIILQYLSFHIKIEILGMFFLNAADLKNISIYRVIILLLSMVYLVWIIFLNFTEKETFRRIKTMILSSAAGMYA